PSAKGDDKFITTDYLQQCPQKIRPVVILFHYGESWNLLRADQRLIFAKSWPRASRYQQGALLQS
ncbi:hypothetical protein RFF63_18440, partial [Acinetobacter baumannii]|uniref:hypothetical protein n=1 Tax=Acinetobacter baumannii TaxID=470 RepID=UPI002810254F|nr:hypothetical protein [Acinetobacter baumannii]MDQ8754600.1 hypothetical protein [Acinetobacter baumannii]MDQ8824921.1 hypothetical protein [Acinetobacter baumannii]MDQ8832200.1 hypothetical protein [Acinetobacter baumannii]